MKLLPTFLDLVLWLNVVSYLVAFDPQSDFSSAVLRDNKLYVLSNKFFENGRPRLSVYNLNTTDVQAIISNSTELNLNSFPQDYLPEFIDIKDNNSNQFYFMGGQKYNSLKSSNIINDQLLSTYDLSTNFMTYRNQKVMKQPPFQKFPQYYYSSTPVQVPQKDGSTHTVIYIFGGYIYSPQLKKPALTNLFYSYNINTQEWSDLNTSVNKYRIPPLGGHTAVLVEDRYIYMLGGLTWPKGSYSNQVANSVEGPPVTTLSKVLYYDTYTEKWIRRHARALDNNDLISKPLFGFTGNYHKGEIILFGGFLNNNSKPNEGAFFNTLYAKYNVKTNKWNFTSIAKDSDKSIKYPLIGCGASVIYNNHLILIDGTRAPKGDFRDRLYAIDLNSDRIVNNLKLEKSASSNGSKHGWFSSFLLASFSH